MAFMKFILVALTFACFIVSCTCEYNCDYKKDGFYSDDDFCHIYWRCNYGVAEEYECPAGTAWNHIEGRCDWLDNVDCTRSEKPKGDDEDGEGRGSDDEESVEQTTRKSKKAKNKAAHETTTMSPIEEDMDVENADNKIVGWSTKVVRSRRQARKNQPRSRVEILTAQTLSTTTATLSGLRSIGNETRSDELNDSDSEDKFDYDDLCSNITQIAYFRDDPFICNKYIRCNHGYAQKFKCYRDTAWDIKRMTCLWVNNVDCGERQLVDQSLLGENDPDESMKHNGTRKTRTTRTTTTTTTTTTISTTTVELLTSEKPSNSLNSQSASGPASLCQPFGSYFIPDNSNCAAYFMCNNGKESKMNCGEKQLFNADTSQCEEFQQVFCGSRPVNLADRNQCQGKRDGIYPDIERTCKVFYQCINQQKVREANCPSTFKFNSLSGRCDNPANIAPPCGTYGVSNAISLTSSLFIIIGLILLQKLTTFI